MRFPPFWTALKKDGIYLCNMVECSISEVFMSDIRPVHYRISLAPDLEQFQFAGTAEIVLESGFCVDEIVLNALDLAVTSCRIRQAESIAHCTLSADLKKEEMKISLPESISGRFTLVITYQGQIGDSMAGFYRSSYVHEGSRRFIAVTQFQESDARRAFPCMDHPSQKATFDIEIVVDEGMTAVSNAAIKEVQVLDVGRRRFVFETTPKMSTYLVFWGVGDFKRFLKAGEKRVGALTLPGMETYAGFGLDFGCDALEFCETYFGIAYPLPKLDLIAIPDFAFGAMENWGAITFRENLLLRYPGITSKSGEGRICEIIAHETVHQWFGNLVTPSDWKYLWLNESFATYFGYGIVDHFHPDWGAWDQFLYGQTAVAMFRDALIENFPIEIPGGEHVVINSSTAPIIYSKGGSILRQIHGYIGEELFRTGLQQYLKTHAYSCAASNDLWQAFETASELPVTRIMKSWIEQPGFPLLEAHCEGRKLTLTQKRFTCLPGDSVQTWVVPVIIAVFSDEGTFTRLTCLLDQCVQTLDLPGNTLSYKVNAGQTGCYRVKYLDPGNLTALGSAVRDKSLSPEDRWGLHGDLYALLIRGDVTLEDYQDFLTFYDQEDAFLPLISIADSLFHLWLLVEDGLQRRILPTLISRFESILARIGYAPQPDETHTRAFLRDQVLWQAARIGSESAADFGRIQFELLKAGRTVNPDIHRSVMQIGALTEGQCAFAWLDRRFRESASEHERVNVLSALGCFNEPPVIEKALDYVIREVPARNQFIPVVSMAANSSAIPLLWDWYTANITKIESFHPLLHERIICAMVPWAGIERTEEIKAHFTDYSERTGQSVDAIKMAIERLEINLRTRRAISILK
jgi:aminopeptidase N